MTFTLPVFDPHWNRQCLQCVHVSQQIKGGVQILRCKKASIIGGGGAKRRKTAFKLNQYCVEVLNEDCKRNGWFESQVDR